MSNVRESYDLPKRPPVAFWQWAVMLAAPLLALGIWRAAPDSPVTVGLLAVTMLVAVFVGVSLVLRRRELSEAPGEHPVPPPSVTPPQS